MKQRVRQTFLLYISAGLIFFAGCTTVPITGRSQFNTVPDSLINSMALQEYNSFLKSPDNKLSTDPEKTAMVQRVGGRIADAVERYMTEHGLAEQIADYEWEFNLIDSDQKKAWAMPGWRLGWMVAPARDATHIAVLSECFNTGAPSIEQFAGIAAL